MTSKIIKTNKLTAFDVDETLVLHEDLANVDSRSLFFGSVEFKVHETHVAKLKAHKARGHTILVWSKGGAEWAERVVLALDLGDCVDLILDKPHWLYDDNPNWPEWVYLENRK